MNCLADKSCRDDVEIGDIAYNGMKSVDDLATGYADKGPAFWRRFANKYNKVKDYVEESRWVNGMSARMRQYARQSPRAIKRWLSKNARKFGTWAGKRIGKKIPVFCNLMEAFSKDCRKWIKNLFAKKKNSQPDDNKCRVKRTVSADDGGDLQKQSQILLEYTIYTSMIQNFIQHNPDMFIFLAGNSAACRKLFTQSAFGKTRISKISAQATLTIVKECQTIEIADFVSANLIIDRWNEMANQTIVSEFMK